MREALVKFLSKFISFSNSGEDKILLNVLPAKGRYLSIGAHHPFRFSNTALLYLRGWSGVNVDIMNGWKFEVFRWRDKYERSIVTPKPVYEETIYCFDEPAYNTCLWEIADDVIKKGKARYIGEKKYRAVRLESLLMEEDTRFDLLDIDIEGMDAQILNGIKIFEQELKDYRPTWILAETHHSNVDEVLTSLGYEQIAYTITKGLYQLK